MLARRLDDDAPPCLDDPSKLSFSRPGSGFLHVLADGSGGGHPLLLSPRRRPPDAALLPTRQAEKGWHSSMLPMPRGRCTRSIIVPAPAAKLLTSIIFSAAAGRACARTFLEAIAHRRIEAIDQLRLGRRTMARRAELIEDDEMVRNQELKRSSCLKWLGSWSWR
jgi:hypothetical protein